MFPRKFEVPDHCFPPSCPIPTKDTHGEGLLYPWVSSSGNRLSCARLEGHCHASFLPSVHFPPQAPDQPLLHSPFLPLQTHGSRCSGAMSPPSLDGSWKHPSYRTLNLGIKQHLPFALVLSWAYRLPAFGLNMRNSSTLARQNRMGIEWPVNISFSEDQNQFAPQGEWNGT